MTDLVNTLLTEVGNRIGFDDFSLNAENQIFLGLENELTMSIIWREETENLLFNSLVNSREGNNLQLLQTLMQANCVFADSHAMAFNISPANNHINLSMVVTISDRSSYALHNKLDMFIRTAAAWHGSLKNPEALAPNWEHPNLTKISNNTNFETFGARV